MWTRFALVCVCGLGLNGCDNEASLVSNNGPTNPNSTPNNTTPNNTQTNNGSNNQSTNNQSTNNQSTNNQSTNNQSTNNQSNNGGNNVEPDIYDTTPDPDTRNYTGTIPAFSGTGPVEQFVYDMTVAACERWVSCKDNINAIAMANAEGFATVADCVQASLNRAPLAGFSAAVAEERAQYFPDEVALCLLNIQSFACDDIQALVRSPRAQVQDCQNALFGLSGPDSVCLSEADCTTGFVCQRIFADDCSGTCQSAEILPALCGTPLAPCAAAQYCDFEANACANIVATNGACTKDEMCGPLGFCNDGLCAPKKFGYQAGQACNYYSNICALGLVCDPLENQVLSGTCVEMASVGQACDSDTDCRFDAVCEAGTCAAKLDTGVCTGNSDCLSNICTSAGTCVSSSVACTL